MRYSEQFMEHIEYAFAELFSATRQSAHTVILDGSRSTANYWKHAVLRHYAGQIKYLSTYRGHINDDIQDRLKTQLIKAVLQFRFDR